MSTMSSTTTTSRPLDVGLEVLQDPHPAGVGREPRDRDEVDLDGDVAGSRGRGRRGRSARPSARRRARRRRGGRGDLGAERGDVRRERRRRRAGPSAPCAAARQSLSERRTALAQERGAQLPAEARRARPASLCACACASGLRCRRYGSEHLLEQRRLAFGERAGTCEGGAPRCRSCTNAGAAVAIASASSSNSAAIARVVSRARGTRTPRARPSSASVEPGGAAPAPRG